MNGRVIEAREAIFPSTIVNAADGLWEIDAVIDTGFNGELLLPPDAIDAIGLSFERDDVAAVAGGQTMICSYYEATVMWNGVRRQVEVVSLDQEPLIGMKLLEGSRLKMDVVDGGVPSCRCVNRLLKPMKLEDLS